MDMSSMNGSSGSTAMSGSMDMSSNTTNISSMNGSTMPHMGVMHSYFFASPTGQFYYVSIVCLIYSYVSLCINLIYYF